MPAAPEMRETLLASYADLGEAMVIENVLEAEGIPCRVADLAQLPAHTLGIGGRYGRSVGLWVLEADLERARSVLATLGAPEHAVDEEALAAAAEAATPGEPPEPEAPPHAPEPPQARRPAGAVVSRSPAAAIAAVVVVASALVLVLSRGCG
ncbi:MAG TPA: DUF2007 domain-containing protein [Anaeromyxobacteraceae bacterium]|nr:DUF2007 domain-containing protein [Anaeromyxobacteraceae bacterium]